MDFSERLLARSSSFFVVLSFLAIFSIVSPATTVYVYSSDGELG